MNAGTDTIKMTAIVKNGHKYRCIICDCTLSIKRAEDHEESRSHLIALATKGKYFNFHIIMNCICTILINISYIFRDNQYFFSETVLESASRKGDY